MVGFGGEFALDAPEVEAGTGAALRGEEGAHAGEEGGADLVEGFLVEGSRGEGCWDSSGCVGQG